MMRSRAGPVVTTCFSLNGVVAVIFQAESPACLEEAGLHRLKRKYRPKTHGYVRPPFSITGASEITGPESLGPEITFM